MIIHIVLV